MSYSKKRITTGLAVTAALFYSSWPLGYFINPAVARHGLASELAGAHQPGAWFFLWGDVIAGFLMVCVAVRLWSEIERRTKIQNYILINIAGFGVATIVDALLPLGCSLSTEQCPNYTQDPLLLIHALFTIIAAYSALFSLFLLWIHLRRRAWIGWLLVSYIVFSYLTLLEAVIGNVGNWAQHYYLITLSIAMAIYPWAVGLSVVPQSTKKRSRSR